MQRLLSCAEQRFLVIVIIILRVLPRPIPQLRIPPKLDLRLPRQQIRISQPYIPLGDIQPALPILTPPRQCISCLLNLLELLRPVPCFMTAKCWVEEPVKARLEVLYMGGQKCAVTFLEETEGGGVSGEEGGEMWGGGEGKEGGEDDIEELEGETIYRRDHEQEMMMPELLMGGSKGKRGGRRRLGGGDQWWRRECRIEVLFRVNGWTKSSCYCRPCKLRISEARTSHSRF